MIILNCFVFSSFVARAILKYDKLNRFSLDKPRDDGSREGYVINWNLQQEKDGKIVDTIRLPLFNDDYDEYHTILLKCQVI